MLEESIRIKSRLLLDRLERISVDSPWAHQASGIRASVAKCLAGDTYSRENLIVLLELGFQILEKAAGEIPEDTYK